MHLAVQVGSKRKNNSNGMGNGNYFIIHDKNRNLCFLYNQKEYKIISGEGLSIPSVSENEKMYQDLWKMFFKTIAIKERTNPRCQMQYMPKKYWKDLIETWNVGDTPNRSNTL